MARIGRLNVIALWEAARMPDPVPHPEAFRAYWYFAQERQRIFEARLDGACEPWTKDPILASHRFCNSYRASDRVSQHLIRVAYDSPTQSAEDLFVRVTLHRLFSRPETWDLLDATAGGLTATTFDATQLAEALTEARENGQRIYTGAFILCATPAFGFSRKHENHLALVQAMLRDDVPERLLQMDSLRAVFEELLTWPLLGPFMAYQVAIDLNYTSLLNFDEDDFTVPGPGALRGLRKVFINSGGLSATELVHWLVRYQDCVEEELGITPPRLFGRPLKAIDCQNLLCEVDKYCREHLPQLRSNRTRIKQRFTPDRTPLSLFYPPKWGINQAAARGSYGERLVEAA